MRGTDWTRPVRLLTYEQGVGGTLARIYGWTPGG